MSRLYKDRSLSGGFITMKRTALCFLLAVFALLFSTASFAEELVPLDAKLEIISGQVKLTRVGSNKTDVINESCDLYAGDLLETLIDSKATLAYADGTNMRIKERTLIEVPVLFSTLLNIFNLSIIFGHSLLSPVINVKFHRSSFRFLRNSFSIEYSLISFDEVLFSYFIAVFVSYT